MEIWEIFTAVWEMEQRWLGFHFDWRINYHFFYPSIGTTVSSVTIKWNCFQPHFFIAIEMLIKSPK